MKLKKKFIFNNFIIFYLWVDFNGMNMRRRNVGVGVNKNIKKKLWAKDGYVCTCMIHFLKNWEKKIKIGN